MRKPGPLVVSFGGGVNSAAMLIGLYERDIRPDLILFADTGGEKPETYAFLETMRTWTVRNMDLGIVTVCASKKTAPTLEASCLRLGVLPSIVYGFRTCSQRWKIEPQEKYLNTWQPARDCWQRGSQVRKAIGIDAGEPQRAKILTDVKALSWFPLIEWGWARPECVEAIQRARLPVPVKSACFFCPSSKKREVLELRRDHPDLFARAVAMERNADASNKSVTGLGRHWSWDSIARADDAQFKMFPEAVETPCMCFDGEPE
jgi:hypothetical protein